MSKKNKDNVKTETPAEEIVSVVDETPAEEIVSVVDETPAGDNTNHIVQPHDEAMQQFGVNPEESYDGSSLKLIPKEWYAPIIRLAINKNGIKPVSTIPNDNLFTVVFDSISKAKEFEESFGVPVINCINNYITEVVNDDPKEYQRALVVETQSNGTVVTIAF